MKLTYNLVMIKLVW